MVNPATETPHLPGRFPAFTCLLAVKPVVFSCFLAGSMFLVMPVSAQMVNDPAETVIFTAPRPVLSVLQAEKDKQGQRKEAEKLGKNPEKASEKVNIEPLPSGLQPQLDLQQPDEEDEASAIPPVTEPIKARAVMVDINSNTLNYDKDHDVYVATGSVHMVISEQNSELYADKLTYDQNQDLVIAEGSVTIIKDGQKTHGSYAKIDLGRKSALINDYLTSVEKVRIKAKNAFVNAKFVQYENGRIIITPDMLTELAGGKGTKKLIKGDKQKPGSNNAASEKMRSPSDEDITQLASMSRELELNDEDLTAPKVDANTDADGVKKSNFALKMKQIDVYRTESGYNRVVGRSPSLYFKGRKIAGLHSTEFSMDEPSGTMEYLGPDIGYDPDYGGMYFGPGWDFRAGEHGSIRVSPLVSFGGGGRRSRGGARFEDKGVGPGAGAVLHYRDPKTFLDVAYNTRVGQPVLLGERKLLDGKTRLRLSANEDYTNGFLGYERPGYGLSVYDHRDLKEFDKFRLSSYSSAGWYKDEFFPTFDEEFFVKAKEDKPGMAGRAQVQLELRNTKPLLRVGKFMDFGLRANIAASGYTTGDFIGLIRGGPTMNLHVGDRFGSTLQYFIAATAGDTPFVFDSYYRGRQNLIWNNSVRINNHLTMGMRSDMNLMRDNDKNALFTGNQLYMLVGPKNVKLNLAYDVIRKRSYFGVNFFPSGGSRALDFEKMRIFQPETYSSPAIP